LMWQVCGEQQDYVCVIEYRKRLGLPTHFNAVEYQDVAKAWKEQALKNGVGLAVIEPDSAHSPKPHPLKSIQIVPVGDRIPPEMEHLQEALASVYPAVPISVGAVEQLPQGSFKVEHNMVIWEVLLERLREEPGRIYVVEQDLGSYDKNGFSFSLLDLAQGRAVISLARLRSLTGTPRDPGTTLDGDVLVAAQHRLQSSVMGTIAKLLGVSFPCDDPSCALRPRRSVADFALAPKPFCEKHTKEIAARSANRPVDGQ
jgi:predicted Zn-dependent protease